jgi:hypothetical protein
VTDPAAGPRALENPAMMANLLQDLLPDAPREAGILSAAAQKNVAGTLREHAERGLDPATSVRLAAASLAATTAFTPEACRWAATEFAVAMDMLGGDTAVSAIPPARADSGHPATTPAEQPATAMRPVTPPGPTDSGSGPITPDRREPGPDPARGQAPPSPQALRAQPAPAVPAGWPAAGAAGPAWAAPGPAADGPSWHPQPGPPGQAQIRPRRRRPLPAVMIAAGIVVALAAAGTAGYRLAASAHPSPADHRPGSSRPGTRAASRPASPATTTPPATAPSAAWIAQLASVSQSAGSAKLDHLLARIQISVPQATVLDSSDYASLRPGYWVIYYQADFGNGAQALAFCAAHGLTTANQCIGRYLSHSAADLGYQCYPPAASPSGNCYYSPDPTSS